MNNQRLNEIVKLVNTNVVIDIGSDHGYVPIAVLKNNRAKQAIIGEINEAPLMNAKKNIKKNGLNQKCEFSLTNGLEGINLILGEEYTIVIAGMGGNLILKIIEKSLEKAKLCKLILQPNNNEAKLREFLDANGFEINNQKIIKDDGIIYEIIDCEFTKKKFSLTDSEIEFGKYKIYDTIFVEKWEKEKLHLKKIFDQIKNNDAKKLLIKERIEKIEEQLGVINEIK